MWNEKKSILLSRILLLIFAAIIILAVIFASSIAAVLQESYESMSLMNLTLVRYFTYLMAVPILLCLYFLNKLLDNISKDRVFIWENVDFLRRISWLMMVAGIIFLVTSYANFYLLLPSGVAMFMFLVIRVLKNVFADAVKIKEENEFTI